MRKFRLWLTFCFMIALTFIVGFFFTGFFVFTGVRLNLLSTSAPVPSIPFIGLMGAAAIFSFCFTLMVSRYFFAPIHQLILALKEVADGNFNLSLPEESHLEDIRKMNQNFNRMVQELSSMELLQSDFIQNVSHEFKTPLAAMEGYASLLSSSPLSEEQKEYTARIMESCRQLASLTGNILQLSKLENQKIVPEKRLFSLDEQLRQCILAMEPLWTQKNLQLDIELPETEYEGNEHMLAQVWMNLFSNAIKFTPDSGSVQIRIAALSDNVAVSFTDSGIGMTEDVQKHIFDKFYQADRSRSVYGNGLGLALVQQIVNLCGGEIQVFSQPHHGTTFTVILPRRQNTENTQQS